MSKIIDGTPISIQRVRRSARIEVFYANDGTVLRVIASRVAAVQQAGVDIMPPATADSLQFEANAIPAAVKTQLVALATLIDTNDTAP